MDDLDLDTPTEPEFDDDGNPFTAKSAALEEEEDELASFVVNEAPTERVESFVEELADAYRDDPELAKQMLIDIYKDLETQGHVEHPDAEIADVLARLKDSVG